MTFKVGPYVFKTHPYQHQKEALQKLIDNRGVAGLLMDPGTGKTKPIIDYMGLLWCKYGRVDWCVAAPLAAMDTWVDQIRQHLGTYEGKKIPVRLVVLNQTSYSLLDKVNAIRNVADSDNPGYLRIVVVNHDLFGYDHRLKPVKTENGTQDAIASESDIREGNAYASVTLQDRVRQAFYKWEPDGMTLDESHRFKSHTSNRTRTLRKISPSIERRQILTGTVMPKNPLDIFAQWLFLNPERFGKNWNAFRCTYAEFGGYNNYQPVVFKNLNTMRKRMAADAYSAKKEDCLDLPAVTDKYIHVRLDSRERNAYKAMERDFVIQIDPETFASTPTVLTKTLRLQEITSGFVRYMDDEDEKQIQWFGDSKLKTCMDITKDIIDGDNKVVIFAHFVPDVKTLNEEINKRFKKIPVFTISGATPNNQREDIRKAFRDTEGAAIFVAQMRTMSLAVNELVVANHAIFYSMSRHRDDYEQARDRLNRHGQEKPVTFWHLVVPGSIEAKILKAHHERISIEDALRNWVREKREEYAE